MARTEHTGFGSKLGSMPTLILVTAVLFVARDIFIPVALSILLAFLLAPGVKWLQRLGLNHVLAVILTVAAALAVIVGITWIVQRQFFEVAAELPKYSDNMQAKWRRIRAASDGEISKVAQGVASTIKKVAATGPTTHPSTMTAAGASGPTTQLPSPQPQNPSAMQEVSQGWSIPQLVEQYSGLVLGPLATMGLILVFTVFILANRRDLRDRILRLVGGARLHVTTQALDDAATRIAHYLLMQSAINICYGICVGIGLWIIGRSSSEGQFPNVLVWALMATLLRFLPYLGPWLAAALPIILSLVLFNNFAVFLATLALYVGLEICTSNLAEPWLYGSSTQMSPVAILASAVFWTWLWGPVGLLLSTPLTACLVVFGKYVPQLEFLAILLGNDEPLEPSVSLYHRLLSMDQDEASDLLEEHAKEHGLQKTFDDVLVPALIMTERDSRAATLDADREAFVFQAMRELVEELGEKEKKRNPGPPVADDAPVTVILLPAHNEPDEISALMFAQVLELAGQKTIAGSKVMLSSEMLELIAAQKSAVVCVCALPPSALAHSRYLCKRLRQRFTDLPTLVALWSTKNDLKSAATRLSPDETITVVSTMTDALEKILEMVQPLLLQAKASPNNNSPDNNPPANK